MPNIEQIFPSDKYELIPRVAVFKTHERVKSGRKVKVDRAELEKIARNHNGQFVRLLRASPFAKGHTLDEGPDGADVPEEDQPDVVGYGVKFFVDKIPSEPDEDFLFCDLYLLKSEKSVLQEYPAISPEYYPSLHQLYPISFLKSSAPELSLPPVLHRYEVEVPVDDESYCLMMQNPLLYKNEKPNMDKDKKAKEEEMEMETEEGKAVKKAQDKETKGSKEDGADLATLKEQMAEVMEILPALKELVEMLTQSEGQEDQEGKDQEDEQSGMNGQEDEHNLLSPAKGVEKVPEKKPAEKFGSTATATNSFVPSYTKKEEYNMDTDELVRYKAEVQAQLDKLKAENDEMKGLAESLNHKNRRIEAEKLVYKLENDFNIVFTSPAVREEEIVTMTELDPESALIYFERAKVRYQKKLPASQEVKKAIKYSTDNVDDIKSLPPEEARKLADSIVKSGLKYDDYLKNLATKGQK